MGDAVSTEWRKARASVGNGNCVEVRHHGGTVQVRDSKDQDGPVLSFTRAEWDAFMGGARADEFDR